MLPSSSFSNQYQRAHFWMWASLSLFFKLVAVLGTWSFWSFCKFDTELRNAVVNLFHFFHNIRFISEILVNNLETNDNDQKIWENLARFKTKGGNFMNNDTQVFLALKQLLVIKINLKCFYLSEHTCRIKSGMHACNRSAPFRSLHVTKIKLKRRQRMSKPEKDYSISLTTWQQQRWQL